MSRILISGANGQVGNALISQLSEHTLLLCDLSAEGNAEHELDLSNSAQIEQTIKNLRPDLIINPAAFTAVDKAEEQRALANTINHKSLTVIGRISNKLNIPVIHFSTDYVFDGSGSERRTETLSTSPINHYGQTKLDGESALLSENKNSIILRTSWVFSSHGQNFVKTMLSLAKDREELNIINDQIGAPTSAEFLASKISEILKSAPTPPESVRQNAGIYHLTCAGEASWHDFACSIFEAARTRGVALKIATVNEIPTSQYPTPAARPLNSRLDCTKFEQTFGVNRMTWQAALDDVMDQICSAP